MKKCKTCQAVFQAWLYEKRDSDKKARNYCPSCGQANTAGGSQVKDPAKKSKATQRLVLLVSPEMQKQLSEIFGQGARLQDAIRGALLLLLEVQKCPSTEILKHIAEILVKDSKANRWGEQKPIPTLNISETEIYYHIEASEDEAPQTYHAKVQNGVVLLECKRRGRESGWVLITSVSQALDLLNEYLFELW